jgi:hypothetical protein|eukprot:1660453-Prymnesium_polylepis.1
MGISAPRVRMLHEHPTWPGVTWVWTFVLRTLSFVDWARVEFLAQTSGQDARVVWWWSCDAGRADVLLPTFA